MLKRLSYAGIRKKHAIRSKGILLMTTAAVLTVIATASADAPRTIESFDEQWRFARFGIMPDGSYQPEPDKPGRKFPISTSTTQNENWGTLAMDGDNNTRWCAANDSKDQWLSVNFKSPTSIKAVQVEWEFDRDYQFSIEASSDGKTWKKLSSGHGNKRIDFPRSINISHLKISVDSLPGGSWASIRELNLFDASGNKISNPEVSAGLSPKEPSFNDSSWRLLNVPHDWGIEGPFRMDLENETGKLPWAGIGWYRKTFRMPSSDSGRRVFLDFDGVMSRPKVYVNGSLAGEWMYGYSSFRIDISSLIKPGAENVVAVRVDNPPKSSRWYPGGGMYRHVYMVKTSPVHIAHWGVFVTTPEISADKAVVKAEITAENDSDTPTSVTPVKIEILKDGKIVAKDSIESDAKIDPGKKAVITRELNVPSPELWDIKSPNLYTLRATLVNGDSIETRFGIREIKWDISQGFMLNGRAVKLNGVCNHHDLGALGSAVNYRGIQRQLEIMREMGCNAIRTSHNPPAPELLDLCDEMGFVVLDELFDAWKLAKKPNDYHIHWDNWHEKDIRNFIMRDRNHPCVIAWSTGNEIPELGNTGFHWVARKLYDTIKEYDTSRPVTAGSNNPGASHNGFQNNVDVFGLNYHLGSYGSVAGNVSGKAVYSSESSSCVSSRGEYFFPVDWNKSKGSFEFQVSSYDLYAPGWACRPDLVFEALDKNPRYAGEFVWTGFDYLGEPTPYNQDSSQALNFQDEAQKKEVLEQIKKLGSVPSRSSYFGIVDLAGFKKDRFYLYQSRWRPELPMAHLLPHWNWPERKGQKTPVHCYTSGDEAELFLNGKSLGRKKKGQYEYRLHWDDVVYQPGQLKVIAYKNGSKWAEDTVSTTGPAAKLVAEPDRAKIKADGEDLCYITVRVTDSAGRTVPRSSNLVKFAGKGPANLIAVDNGDPTSLQSFQIKQIKAFNGMCLAIIQSRKNMPGAIAIQASASGLSPAVVRITAE